MIVQMIKWGYQEGKTLFGFGYDFRQSNRLSETLDRFSRKLESVYIASGEKKINLITHSMGGLLVKCFMSLHSDVFEKYIKSWIAIAAPFQGTAFWGPLIFKERNREIITYLCVLVLHDDYILYMIIYYLQCMGATLHGKQLATL
jgi:pimeloyl-ACP methyl ester carboxylesterase